MKVLNNGLVQKILDWLGLVYTGNFSNASEFYLFFGYSLCGIFIFFLIVFVLLRSLTDIAKGVRL